MGLDIRWPIGLMFTLIGALLSLFGALNSASSMSLDININLVWGIVLLIFGAAMLTGAILGARKNSAAAKKDSPSPAAQSQK